LTNGIFYEVISVKKTSWHYVPIIIVAVVEHITCQNQDPWKQSNHPDCIYIKKIDIHGIDQDRKTKQTNHNIDNAMIDVSFHKRQRVVIMIRMSLSPSNTRSRWGVPEKSSCQSFEN